MPKTDLVPVFYPGSSQEDGPDFLELRSTVRLWKKEGRGYFASSGQVFQLVGPIATVVQWQESLGSGNILPFSRVQNPWRKPDRINYPIPAVGAHNRPFHVSDINQVPPVEATA